MLKKLLNKIEELYDYILVQLEWEVPNLKKQVKTIIKRDLNEKDEKKDINKKLK